jgi:hypothetical protein
MAAAMPVVMVAGMAVVATGRVEAGMRVAGIGTAVAGTVVAGMWVVGIGTAAVGTVEVVAGMAVVTAAAGELDPR